MSPRFPGNNPSIRAALAAAVLGLVFMLGYQTSAAAQSADPPTREEELARQQRAKAKAVHPYTPGFVERQLLEIEDTGGFAVVRPIGVAFGDIKPGSGIAFGPETGRTFANGAVVLAKAEYSINNFKLGQVFFQSAPIAEGRLMINGRVRWQDAPKVAMYGVGPNAPSARANYSEQKTEISAQAFVHPVSFVRLAAGTAYEKFLTNGGAVDLGEERPLPVVPTVPGLNADPGYLHSYGSAALDSRETPGYSRSGTLLQAVLHDYRDQDRGQYSFRQVNGIAQQLVPILHGNVVLDLSARAWTTGTTGDDIVPFFVMPSLGGSNFLRGFPQYRFRDRHALLLTGQYKWYVQEYLDAVLFYEAGKVAARTKDLDLNNLEKAYGFGVHVHTPGATLLRLEVAHSRETTRFIIGFAPDIF